MKKSIFALLLCISLALPIAACGGKDGAQAESGTSAETESEAVSEGAEGETGETEEEDPYIYAFEYDLSKYVKLCDYKGLEYTTTDTSCSDEELQDYIDYILDASSDYEQILDRAAAEGDTVMIDYVGTIDGEEFDGGSAEGYELTLGSGTFIDGFEDGLIGVTPGETVTLDLKFPDDYHNTDYAGKAVKFETTIQYIEGELVVPELNDEFVQSLGVENLKTVDELKNYLKKSIEEDKLSSASYSIQSELMDKVVSQSEIIEYPAEMVQVFVDSVTESIQEEISAAAESETEDGETAQERSDPDTYFQELYGESIEDYCKESVKEMMIICAVAQKEGIEITEETFDDELEAYAQENNLGSGELLKSQYQTNYLKLSMIYDRVLKKLQEYGTPVEAQEELVSE